MFGPHLTLDLYGCNKKKLSDLDFIFRFLDELPSEIGMHKISKPNVTFYQGKPNSFDKGGISGFVLITESHITIHTFIEQQYASIDIFSCKDFDVKRAENIIAKKFEAKKVEKNLIMRGREFPHDTRKVQKMIAKFRKRIR